MVKEKYSTFSSDGDMELEVTNSGGRARSQSGDDDDSTDNRLQASSNKTDYSVFTVTKPNEIKSSGIVRRRESEIIIPTRTNFSLYNNTPKDKAADQAVTIIQPSGGGGVKLNRRSSEMVSSSSSSKHKKTLAVSSLFHSDSRNAFSSNLPIDGVELYSNRQRMNRPSPATLEEAASTINLRGSINDTLQINDESNDVEAELEDTITSLPSNAITKKGVVKRHQSVLVVSSVSSKTGKISRNESDVGSSKKPRPIVVVPDQQTNMFSFSESLQQKKDTASSLEDISQKQLREKYDELNRPDSEDEEGKSSARSDYAELDASHLYSTQINEINQDTSQVDFKTIFGGEKTPVKIDRRHTEVYSKPTSSSNTGSMKRRDSTSGGGGGGETKIFQPAIDQLDKTPSSIQVDNSTEIKPSKSVHYDERVRVESVQRGHSTLETLRALYLNDSVSTAQPQHQTHLSHQDNRSTVIHLNSESSDPCFTGFAAYEINWPRTYLTLSVIGCMICNPISGLVAIIFSLITRRHIRNDRIIAAKKNSKRALVSNIVTLTLGTLCYIGLVSWLIYYGFDQIEKQREREG